jgi:hypothetical protein
MSATSGFRALDGAGRDPRQGAKASGAGAKSVNSNNLSLCEADIRRMSAKSSGPRDAAGRAMGYDRTDDLRGESL